MNGGDVRAGAKRDDTIPPYLYPRRARAAWIRSRFNDRVTTNRSSRRRSPSSPSSSDGGSVVTRRPSLVVRRRLARVRTKRSSRVETRRVRTSASPFQFSGDATGCDGFAPRSDLAPRGVVSGVLATDDRGVVVDALPADDHRRVSNRPSRVRFRRRASGLTFAPSSLPPQRAAPAARPGARRAGAPTLRRRETLAYMSRSQGRVPPRARRRTHRRGRRRGPPAVSLSGLVGARRRGHQVPPAALVLAGVRLGHHRRRLRARRLLEPPLEDLVAPVQLQHLASAAC